MLISAFKLESAMMLDTMWIPPNTVDNPFTTELVACCFVDKFFIECLGGLESFVEPVKTIVYL